MIYKTCCIHALEQSIIDMVDEAKEITFRTALKLIGRNELAEIFSDYTWGRRIGLKMKNDWCVRYYKSTYEGNSCVFIDHSAIEYIFI